MPPSAVPDAPDPVAEDVLEDLRRRLEATRRPALPDGVGWERGTDAAYLAELVADWAARYDWRAHETRIRSLPWRRAPSGGRLIDRPAADTAAPVVVLLHGWPDSVLRYERVLPLLGDLRVVVPALPGYPWGAPVTAPGMSAAGLAAVIAADLAELGIARCVVSGGDIGTWVAEAMAAAHPERVSALHLTDLPFERVEDVDPGERTEAERAFLAAGREWERAEGAYDLQQSTRPHSLAPALADSPAGLAAWIVEKLRAWSDCGGEVESVFPRDDLLTWITAYWVTGSIGTSFSPYVEPAPPVGRIEVPTVVTQFPRDLVLAPRDHAERRFDLRGWTVGGSGGHFAAWERPEAFAAGVRAAVAAAS